MADSDILVCPSAFEAYGMAVAEAAASGLPVLSNRVGAAEQLIQHGVTGFLATVGDWDSLGRYLELCLEDAALRATFRRQPPPCRSAQLGPDLCGFPGGLRRHVAMRVQKMGIQLAGDLVAGGICGWDAERVLSVP